MVRASVALRWTVVAVAVVLLCHLAGVLPSLHSKSTGRGARLPPGPPFPLGSQQPSPLYAAPGPVGAQGGADSVVGGNFATARPAAPSTPVAWPRAPVASPPPPTIVTPPNDDRSRNPPAPVQPPVPAHDPSLVAARLPAGAVNTATPTATTSLAPAVKEVPVHPQLHHFLRQFPSLKGLPARYPIQDKFTVVMINYNRPNHLLWQLQRLAKCNAVHRIYIRVNSGKASVGNQVMSFAESHPKIRLMFPTKNSLNNRFIYPDDVETEFCMSIDDDIEVLNTELEWGFRVARQYPAQITGFFPRTVEKKGGGYKYVIPHFSKKDYTYNVVLTGSGSFFNSRWLHVYSKVMPQPIRSYIDEHFNCEDIAFNMMMSNATRLPPVLLVGSAHTTKAVKEAATAHSGLRTRHGHVSGRSECLAKFISIYGRDPLVSSDAMVVPFTFDRPSLRAIMKSTQIHKDPFWWPNK